jgi:hypothetical protein
LIERANECPHQNTHIITVAAISGSESAKASLSIGINASHSVRLMSGMVHYPIWLEDITSRYSAILWFRRDKLPVVSPRDWKGLGEKFQGVGKVRPFS